MDPFEKAAQGVVGGFDDAAAQVVDNQQSGLRNTLYDALLSNPDVSARATKLGRQTGLAPDLVERNLPEIERNTRLDQLDALPKDNPILANWLADPVNARLAHDDLDTLDLISKSSLLRQPAVPKLSESYGFSQASRDLRAAQQKSESAVSQYVDRNMPTSEIFGRERTVAEGLTEPFMRGLARGRRGITLLMGMAGMYEGDDAGLAVRLGQQNRQAEAYPIPENVQAGNQAISEAEGFGDAAWAILSNPGAVKETVIESMGISAPSLLAAGGLSVFGPGGTAAGAGLGSFAVEYGATIQDVIAQNGVNASDPMEIHRALNDPDIMAAAKEKALARGVPIAIFDALTAGFAGKLLAGAKNTTGSAATRTAGELGIQAAGGGAGEATAQLLTDEFKPGEILLEAIAELPTGLIEIPANYQHARDKAMRADTNAKAIKEINNFSQSAKVLQRDPETFQTFIAAAAEDGPVQNVFIDGRTLLQSGMAPSIAELSPAVREQLDRSLLTGGMIAIPVDEYAARIAPTEFAPQLLDHLKTDPEGFSRTEAADFLANQGAELQAEVERVIGNQADADTFRASQDVVKQDILGQLNTAGRFTPQVNEAYATLASAYSAVRAAQLGLTPEAFHQQRGMRVQGAAVAGQQFNQAFDLPDGYTIEEGTKGLAKGKFRVIGEDGESLGNWEDTNDAAINDALKNTRVRKASADETARRDEAYSRISSKVSAGAALSDVDLTAIGLKPGQSRFDYLSPRIQRLLGIPARKVREAIGDALRKGQGQFGGAIEIANSRDAIANAAKWAKDNLDPADPNILNQSANDTDAFRQWAGTDEVIESEDINDFDFSGQGPFVMRGYHGTTNTFEEFNASLKGNMEGQFGAVNYFTSSEHDATENYAGEGPDLTQRIELKAERVSQEIEDYRSEFDDPIEAASALMERYGEDVYDDNDMDMARAIVRKELHGGEEKVLEVYIKTERPFVVNDDRSPWFEIMDEGEIEALAVARVADNEGVTVDEIEASRDDYQDQIDEARYEVMDEQENPLIAAVQSVADKYDFDAGELLGSLYEVARDGTIKHANLEELLRSNESLVYAENPENGDLIQSHMIGEIIQALGFDSIILKNADTRFESMNMEHGTAHIHVFDANNTNIKSVENAGEFDPTNPNIYHQPDGGAGANRGGFSPNMFEVFKGDKSLGYVQADNRDEATRKAGNTPKLAGFDKVAEHPVGLVTLLDNADLSTFLHESSHYFFQSDIQLASELLGKESLTPGEQQIVDDVSRLLTWHGINGDVTEQLRQWHTMDFEEQRSHHERTAESFEAYLFSGTAPNLELQPIFQRFRAWMVNVYKSLKDFLTKNPEAGKLNDEVRSVFDRMIATQEQIQLAEQARSLTALFASPETSGMTPEAFAAYQALGVDATNTAIEQLQAKGLRDMQWLTNAKGRAVKKLQKESKAVRAEITMEARREVMSQSVYRAWDFLTRKLSDNDKLPPLERKSDPDVLDPTLDSLFVAIAKLGGIQKSQVLSEWGVDPKDMPQSGLFGKPVWRITEGLPIDSMAAALAEHGYLPLNEHGQYDLNDLGDRFLEELSGNTQYSHAYQPQDLQPGEQIANPAGLMAGRLDLAGLASIGIPDEIAEHIKTLKMTATDGLHPDLVATLFEFSSGDELVRTLAAAPTPKDAITALAEQMMLERFGELSSPDAIERAADAAIHNDVRARMLATEVNALAKAIGKPKILASAAKAFAADMIARLKVRDVRPGQYANAEAKASKAADKAHKAGDTALAASEKRNQIVQHYATRAAYDAQDEVRSGLRYLKKFDKRSKTIDPDYQDQIEAMLERFELRAISNKAVDRRTSLAQWLTAQRDAGLEPDIDPKLENEAFRTSYKNITVEEFRGLLDAVKQIEHLGRLKNKLLTAQDQRAFKVIVDEVAGSIVDNGGTARKVELETPKGIRPWLEGVAAGHRKIASLIRQMDGLKDGGPFWRVLVRGMNEASTNETVMIEQATVKLAELYKPMLALKGGLNGDKRFIPEINDSLTRGGRLSVALNWGNAANRQRILDGDQWTEHQVHAVLKTLTREEWAFVQNVWTFIDSYWPQIEAKEKRVTGRAPDKVAAEPFSYMVDGEMVSLSGGYYPIKYDSNRDDKAEKHDAAAVAQDMMRGAMTRSTTRRGHTKARMESVNRPVKKTLDVITQHVSEVTHDLAWHEWLVDANRLLDAKPINQAIRDYYGTEVLRTMKDALTSIATADIIPQDAIDRALLYLRANVSRATMGLSLTTAFLQPFGLLQSTVRIGVKPVLRGMARWAGDAARFESSMTWIGEKSDFMRLRSKTFNRELHEIKGRVSHGHSKARQIYDASLFMLMQKMQMVADVPTWIGAYEKALADNQDDATAVALADQSVLDSQGGGQTKDMAAFQRKHPFLTMFYSYFSTTLNLAAESTAATNFRNPLAVAGWAADMALLMVIPALGPAMILAMMKGDDCGDLEECAVKLARVQAGYLMNLMLGVREFSGLTSGFDYSGPPVGRVVTELERTSTQIGQGEADEALAMSSISLLGVSLGIPTTQIIRSYRGWKAWEDGEAPATSILMGPPPKD